MDSKQYVQVDQPLELLQKAGQGAAGPFVVFEV